MICAELDSRKERAWTCSPVPGSKTDRVGSISKQPDRRVECDPLRILIHAYGFCVFSIVFTFTCSVQSSLVWLGSSVSFVSYPFRARHELNPPVHQDINTTTTLVERTLKTMKKTFGIVAYPAEHLDPAGCKPLRMSLNPSQDLCWIHNVFRMPELTS